MDSGATQAIALSATSPGGWTGVFKVRPPGRLGKAAPPDEAGLVWAGATPEDAQRHQAAVGACGVRDLFADEWVEPLEAALPWPELRTDTRFWPWLRDPASHAGVVLGIEALAMQAAVSGVSTRMWLEQAGPAAAPALLRFIHGQNSSALTRLAVFDLLVSQADRHQEHMFVSADGDPSHPICIDSSTTVFNYGRLSNMLLPGTFYHERAHIGQYFGMERPRSFQNPNLWPFDYRCHAPNGTIGTNYPPELRLCIGRFASGDTQGLGLTEAQSGGLSTRARELLGWGFERTLRSAGREAFKLMYGRQYFPEGRPPELWPVGYCCRLSAPRGKCVNGSTPQIPPGYPPGLGEPGAEEYWAKLGRTPVGKWRPPVRPSPRPAAAQPPPRPGAVPVPPPHVPARGAVLSAEGRAADRLWTWTTHTCEGGRPCQDPQPVSRLPADWAGAAACGGSGHSVCAEGPPRRRLVTWGRNDSRGGGGGGTPGLPDAGQLGRGGAVREAAPVPGFRAISAAAGRYHTVAATEAGEVWTWGLNDYGQLGRAAGGGCTHGEGCHDGRPARVPGLEGRRVARVAAGRYFSLAVTTEGAVISWGRSACGWSGAGEAPSGAQAWRSVEAVPRGVTLVDAGYVHWVALTSGGELLTCDTLDDGYGRPRQPNADAELGRAATDAAQAASPAPQRAIPGRVISAAAGRCFTLALTDRGELWCWGCRCGGPRPSLVGGLLPEGDTLASVHAAEYAAAAVSKRGWVVQWIPTPSSPQSLQRWTASPQEHFAPLVAAGHQLFVIASGRPKAEPP
eukprot:TRINITY_DN32118_c0_g1_i1.p1 TRINITY_DN32118_c0_g1~~TRINITY_DN32118_c0_g1_i1.p1  ORF type:complete len:793 (+),score=222.64 TRINITY_DN32118_c0_g1_i1:299-2677(+)